jgi:hypothetical protein
MRTLRTGDRRQSTNGASHVVSVPVTGDGTGEWYHGQSDNILQLLTSSRRITSSKRQNGTARTNELETMMGLTGLCCPDLPLNGLVVSLETDHRPNGKEAIGIICVRRESEISAITRCCR